MMNNTCKDDEAIASQIRSIYARGNMLIKNFSKCSDEIKCLLFRSYCSNFYGCPLWCNSSVESRRRLKVAYNCVFRVLLKLEHRTSMSFNFIQHDVLHSDVLIRKAIVGFMARVTVSDNILISTIFNSMYYLDSTMYKHWTPLVL